LSEILDSGAGLERFRRLVELQGGDARVIDDPDSLPGAPIRTELTTPDSGFVEEFDALEVGWTSVMLGAGRRGVADQIDPAVGVELLVKVGTEVEAGQPVARIHARTAEQAAAARKRLSAALTVSDHAPRVPPLVLKRMPGQV
jgi:thymidine phosphorylase